MKGVTERRSSFNRGVATNGRAPDSELERGEVAPGASGANRSVPKGPKRHNGSSTELARGAGRRFGDDGSSDYLSVVDIPVDAIEHHTSEILTNFADRLLSIGVNEDDRRAFLEDLKRELIGLVQARVSSGGRIFYNDRADGFRIRRDRHREAFKETWGRRPIPYSEDDYTVLDFLHDVWGDVIARGQMSSSFIIEHDFPLYRALNDYVRGVRSGSFYRAADPTMTLSRVFSTADQRSASEDQPVQ